MITLLRKLIIASLIIGSLTTCTDHQLQPTSPLRLRLKTATYFTSGREFGYSRTFTYDTNNRPISCANSNGTKIVYEYDEQNRYKRYITSSFGLSASGEVTQFVYSASTNNFQVFIGSRQQRDYIVAPNKQILSYTSTPAGLSRDESYTYTGDNVTVIDYKQGSVTDRISYQYDTHPNPYYGLIADGIRSELSLSRNNVTKFASVYGSTVSNVVEYTYEYNAQGFPIKQKAGSFDVTAFTYESY